MKLKTTILLASFFLVSSIMMGQWTSASFLAKGYNLVYGYHPTVINNNTAIICGNYTTDYMNFTGKIFRTTDGGASFSEVLSAGVVGFNDAFFIDNTKGFAVGEEVNTKLLIAKTVNGGASWTTTLSDSLYKGLDVYFFDANTGLIAGDGGIIRTTDGGATWNVVLDADIIVNQFSFPSANIGYAIAAGVSTSKVFKTTDAGNTWIDISSPSSNYDLRGIYFTNISTGFIACGSDKYLIRTNDGGQNWSQVTVPSSANLYDIKFVNASLGYLVGETVYEAIILKTINGGNTWTTDYSTPDYFSHYGLDIKGSFSITCGVGGYAKNTTISSVHEISLNDKIKVFPLITSSKITIQDFEENPVEAHYYISDILGKVVNFSSFRESVIIDLSDYPSGVYIVNVCNKSGILNQKLIKE